MSKGSFSATAADSIIIAKALMANAGQVEIHYHSSDTGFLGFGAAGVEGEGIKISSGGPYYKIDSGDPRLLMDVHMICPAGETVTGGYQIT